MHHLPVMWYVVGLTILAGNIFAVWKGQTPERLAGGLTLGVIFFEQLLELIGHLPFRFETLDLALAVVVAAAYIIIAFKSASIFLGAAMLCQAAELFTVGEIFSSEDPHSNLGVWTNYETLAVTCFVVASVIWHLMRKPATPIARDEAWMPGRSIADDPYTQQMFDPERRLAKP